MADVLPSQLMNSVMGKLYDTLASGDETVKQSEDNFFSWATPGIPVEPEDFEFLSQGLTGVVKKADIREMVLEPAGGGEGTEAEAAKPELTPELLDQLRAQDTAQLYMQAENFARLVDFVPDVTAGSNNQLSRLNILNNEGSLSDVYRYTLRMSQVAESQLDDKTKEKIEKFRKLLSVTTVKKNIIDDTETEVSEPSPLVKAYFEKMAAYEDTALQYNSRRIDALAASTPQAVHYWAMNANILRNKVRAAMQDWVSTGYKNDYEQIAAYIDQVMLRDMTLLKQEYRDDVEKARLTGLASGSDFFYSSLIPGNFARSRGWTKFAFGSGDFKSHASSNFSTKRWKTEATGGLLTGFGFFGGSGSVAQGSTKTANEMKFDSQQFSLNFEISQVPIVRPWFKPAFLLSRSWRYDQNDQEAKSEILSNGALPAKGLMPAYPTTCIFIRNLRLNFGTSSGFRNFMSEQVEKSGGGGGIAAIGPFTLGGGYNRATTSGSTQHNVGHTWERQELQVPGMQIIGFKCHIMPKSPNPLPTITNWV